MLKVKLFPRVLIFTKSGFSGHQPLRTILNKTPRQLEQVRAEGRTMAERVGRQLGDRDNAHAEKVVVITVVIVIIVVFDVVVVIIGVITVIVIIIWCHHPCCHHHCCHGHCCHRQFGDNTHAE